MQIGRIRNFLLSLTIVGGLATILLFAPPSWADTRHGHDRHPGADRFVWHVLKAKEALGLSDEQEARLRNIGVSFKKDNVRKTADVELAEIDLHQLLHRRDQPFNAGEVENSVRKLYALKADRRIASIKAFEDARNVLTEDQRTKLKELFEKERSAMGHRKHGSEHEAEAGGSR
jgi:Spy/CpxP family protein refolding chaperone